MRKEILAAVSRDLLSISPLIFRLIRRRIARTAASNLDPSLTPLHFEIMRLLEEEGRLHPSEIGERLQIAKAQMTKLIDKLVALNIVERTIDTSDRRTVNVKLTHQARVTLKEHNSRIMEAAQDIVSPLSDEDLEKLLLSLRTLRDTLLKAQTTTTRVNAA